MYVINILGIFVFTCDFFIFDFDFRFFEVTRIIMPVESLKSKVEGNQLDLSLSSLTSVPVKELAALPKVTCLDLSCNQLTWLPPDFCALTHIVKLDLSQNQLTELPEDFGCLSKLQHLDLYQNQLSDLPISFCRLNSLKWLDMRDNQLADEGLVAAAGDCLSNAQCQTCAKQVVAFMKKMQSDRERERQKQLKSERDALAAQQAEEEREMAAKRAKKKAEKERRRLQQTQKAAEQTGNVSGDNDVDRESVKNGHTVPEQKVPVRGGLSCFQIVLATVLLAISLLCALYVFCSPHLDDEFCHDMIHLIHYSTDMIHNMTQELSVHIQVAVNKTKMMISI